MIHKEKPKEITTVTVVWIPDLNMHNILRTSALNFSKNYEWFERAISKTRKSVSSGIQTPPSRSKKTRLRLVFSTHFSGFGYPDEILFLVFDILHPSFLSVCQCVVDTTEFFSSFEASQLSDLK